MQNAAHHDSSGCVDSLAYLFNTRQGHKQVLDERYLGGAADPMHIQLALDDCLAFLIMLQCPNFSAFCYHHCGQQRLCTGCWQELAPTLPACIAIPGEKLMLAQEDAVLAETAGWSCLLLIAELCQSSRFAQALGCGACSGRAAG